VVLQQALRARQLHLQMMHLALQGRKAALNRLAGALLILQPTDRCAGSGRKGVGCERERRRT